MAAEKKPKQKSLTSFFGGGKKENDATASSDVDMDDDDDEPKPKPKPKPEPKAKGKAKAKAPAKEAEASSDYEMDDGDDEEVEEVKPKTKAKGKKPAAAADADGEGVATGRNYVAPEESNLPPLSALADIFADMVGRLEDVSDGKIKDVVQHISGRELRVATMCSGTESPLLALRMITRAMKDRWGLDFNIDHVFSCEIVPFKQAYIERNFHPRLLFRDVCELGGTHAHTAYGSLAAVPGNVDMLVAGTSCVDYSNLNNEKKEIDQGGESGRTFHGMLSWVQNHRPPIVILENVLSAPWPAIKTKMESIGYSAMHRNLDTKQFYIPHTRNRGYLVAVDRARSPIPQKWRDWMGQMQRPASVPLDAFLLQSDDPRIQREREKLVQESYNSETKRTGRTDWMKCESRHQRARLEEGLGTKRPLTNWGEGHITRMPDFGWTDWGKAQVERVWDLLDISLLRSAKLGVDPAFKSQVWNLSQNVDRSTGSSKVGISPCLTPAMIPYITNRGGPMVGLEALHFQGLPIDELLLTRETEDQEADLAGNAMSTTVVGASMLVALALSQDLLRAGNSQSYEAQKNLDTIEEAEEVEGEMKLAKEETKVEEHIGGFDQLVENALDLTNVVDVPLSKLLSEAEQSVRLCACEGRKDITTVEVRRCADCGTTACAACGGRPEHNYEPIDVVAHPRSFPSGFARQLKSTLPMALKFNNLDEPVLDRLRSELDVEIADDRWDDWRDCVLAAVTSELRFVELKRQAHWAALYESDHARLELTLHPTRPTWLLFAKPAQSYPANAEIRKTLLLPVARFRCSGALFEGKWEVALPAVSEVEVQIEGTGELVMSWEARLGLQKDTRKEHQNEPDYREKQVWSALKITAPASASLFDRPISGTYTLLDKCGTANAALHRKEGEDDVPLFFFLDPSRCGNAALDPFVFAEGHRRYEYGEGRPVVARLAPSWRQSSVEGPVGIKCTVPQIYVPAPDVSVSPPVKGAATVSAPKDEFTISASEGACATASALLVVKVPLNQSAAGEEWPRGVLHELAHTEERATFRRVAWLTERVKVVHDGFGSWHDIDAPCSSQECERCAPKAPSIGWIKIKNKVHPIENSTQAGEYERRLKARPAPFVTQLMLDDESQTGVLRLGVNFTSLMHRAAARLPPRADTRELKLSWRLDTDFLPLGKLPPHKFTLLSNRPDPEHAQPPSFKKYPLRKEQLRSLSWMLAQEKRDCEPFIEEEISEAILEPLGWRAEGRAQRPIRVLGGVLADEVGYGKTAISLGLIDCARKKVREEVDEAEEMKGKIRVKATLVVVPPHLTLQWESEIKKFVSEKAGYRVVRITTATDLNKLSIEATMEDDIVIVASNIFKSSVYLENVEALGGGAKLPNGQGRFFNARLDTVLEGLAGQVDRLRNEGSAAVMEAIHAGRKASDEAEEAMKPSKRLRGIHPDVNQKTNGAAPAKANGSASTSKKLAVKTKDISSASSSKTPSPTTGEKRKHRDMYVEARSPVAFSEANTPIPSSRATTPAPSGTDATEGEDDDDLDLDLPIRPKRRTAAKKVTVIDSDSEVDEAPTKKRRLTKAGASKASRSASPDFVPSDAEEEQDEEEEDDVEFVASDSEEEKPKRGKAKPKGKVAAKPKAPAKGKKSKKVDSDEEMDVEEDEDEEADEDEEDADEEGDDDKPKKKSKAKAKPKKDTKPKVLRESKDPWKLKGAATRDYTEMLCPPLEMFHWSRIIIDEYTYLDGKVLSMISRLTGERIWVLSGTSPTKDFPALKTIARFLGVHLGIDDDGESKAVLKKRMNEYSEAEKFHSFREAHSLDWHAHRNTIGQNFLDRFVRQNVAEIDEIKWEEHYIKVQLPAAERAIYLELEHHLRSLEMTIKRVRKNESDREKRLAKSMGESKTAEEALLKRCSHFELETKKENAMRACDFIVKERTEQLKECKEDLVKTIKKALEMEKEVGIREGEPESFFRETVRVIRGEGVGDSEAKETAVELLEQAGVGARAPKTAGKKMKDSDRAEAAWKLREQSHNVRRLIKELVGRVRSLRYFTVVRDLQKQKDKPPVVDCPGCGRDEVPLSEIAVLSSCGHTGCYTCVKERAVNDECVYAGHATLNCQSQARVINIVKGETLGVDEKRDGEGRRYGAKLEQVIELLKDTSRVKKNDRVLIFVQFPDLMKKVNDVLSARGIQFLEIRGSASAKSKSLEQFQNGSKERVLLLNVMDESASGANLTGANHAIFLSPLLTESQEEYDACETQAIGRLRRYGQRQTVHIWRFVTMDTMDVEQYEKRRGKNVDELIAAAAAAAPSKIVEVVDSDVEME
ncbi:unnamed protein product [Peniophora sp. CBMAI 1063]|nr:unnamed protein product [Peniophora sp. CBMAI 1063]